MVRGAIQLRTKVKTKQDLGLSRHLSIGVPLKPPVLLNILFSPQSFFLGKVVISMAKHDFTQISFALVSPRLS